MTDIIAAGLILLGGAFILISALGLLRMPDLYMRMHAATKAGTLGAGLMLGALAVFFGGLGVVAEALAVIIFLLLTAPVAAHVLGRASYRSGVTLWEETRFDELEALPKHPRLPSTRPPPRCAHPSARPTPKEKEHHAARPAQPRPQARPTNTTRNTVRKTGTKVFGLSRSSACSLQACAWRSSATAPWRSR